MATAMQKRQRKHRSGRQPESTDGHAGDAAFASAGLSDDGPGREERGQRPLQDILADLRKPIPPRLLETKRLGGQPITFCSWHRVQKILNHYTRGFITYEVRERVLTERRIMLTVRVTIHAAEGAFFSDGTGIEDLDTKGYGDPQSAAESQAFRRACARFGLGLGLYEKGE